MRAIFGLILSLSLAVPSAAQVAASHSATIVVPRFTLVSGGVTQTDSSDVTHAIEIYSNQMPLKVVYSERSLSFATGGASMNTNVTNYLVAWTPEIEARILMGLGAGFANAVTDSERAVVTVTD